MTTYLSEAAFLRSSEIRVARKPLRRGLQDGSISLSSVLADPPECLLNVPLFTLITWRRGWGKDMLRKIGALAVRDRVNLALQVGDAGDRTKTWLMELDRTTRSYGPRA